MTPSDNEPMIIAICGGTGTGKSSFINDVSGADLLVGHRQRSCTENVQFAPLFELDGRDIQLVDTPGFDDSSMSDAQILEKLATFLKLTYGENQLLTGMIYMHRITDNRMGGVSRRNFRVFRELCGKDSLVNVVVTTNMWSNPPTSVELEREQELKESKLFFEPVLSKGARTARYIRGQGVESAYDIIRMFMSNTARPVQMQEEQAANMSTGETSAGKVLNEELMKLIKKHKDELEGLRKEMQDALKRRDIQAREELEEYKRQSESDLAKVQVQLGTLKQELNSEKDHRTAEAKKYREENQKHREEMDKLRNETIRAKQAMEDADGEEREQLAARIAELEQMSHQRKRGFWWTIAEFFDGIFS